MKHLLSLSTLLFVGCAPVDLRVSHAPSYDASTRSSTITATAAHRKGIKRVNIEIIEGPLVSCDKNTSLPCRATAEVRTMRCEDGRMPKEMVCQLVLDTPVESLISYKVKVEGIFGVGEESEEVTYATGPLNPAVSKQTGRPLSWRRRKSRRWSTTLDLAFVPNRGDFESFGDFAQDARQLLSFDSKRPSLALFTQNPSKFSYWLFPQEGEAGTFDPVTSRCDHELQLSARSLMDGNFILHRSSPSRRDCAQILLGGGLASVNTNGNRSSVQVTFAHESGHAVFGLGDEYRCGGHDSAGGRCANVFRSERLCENQSHGDQRTNCQDMASRGRNGVCDLRAYRFSDGAKEIMGAHVNGDWQDDSADCVDSIMKACDGKRCYARDPKKKRTK